LSISKTYSTCSTQKHQEEQKQQTLQKGDIANPAHNRITCTGRRLRKMAEATNTQQGDEAYSTLRRDILKKLYRTFRDEWEPEMRAAQAGPANITNISDGTVTEQVPQSKFVMNILGYPYNVHRIIWLLATIILGMDFWHAHFDPPPIKMFIRGSYFLMS
jgi:hypothetical protein